jgi:Flp pilus assembly protein TadG
MRLSMLSRTNTEAEHRSIRLFLKSRLTRLSFIKKTDGVAAVEFGLILPVLMLVLMGILEYGYVFYVDLTLTNAAREGARVGVTYQNEPLEEAETAAQKYLTDYLPTLAKDNTDVDAVFEGQNIKVSATVSPFEPIVGYLPPSALPGTLTATSSMRWEWAP